MRPDPAARPPRSRKRCPVRPRHMLAAAAGIGMVLVTGCAGGSGSGTPVSGTITIAAAPGIDDAPLYMAQQKGYFTAAGLNVVIKNFGTANDELAAVEDGKAQIAAADYGNIFAEQGSLAKGNLQILADGYDPGPGNAAIMVSPAEANKIKSPKDLQGLQAIGLPSDSVIPASGSTGAGGSSTAQTGPGSLLAAAASDVMHSYLIASTDALHWTAMPQAQEVSWLRSGQLKAALLTEPYIYQAEASFGASVLVDVFSGPTASMPESGYVTTSSWVSGNSAAVADFQSAISRAQAQAGMVGPIQQALRALPPSTGMTTAAATMVTPGTYPTSTSVTAVFRVVTMLATPGWHGLSQQAQTEVSIRNMLVKG
jgi:NitT/TauT family transport system substrate-binding protein